MTAFEDTTPFVLALLITFTALVFISMWNNFNSVKVEKEVSKPKNDGPSRTRELLIRFTKFYNDLDAHNNYLYDTQLLPDPKQHIIHALYVGYDESENDEDIDDQLTNLENLNISDEQKKYIDFNNKRKTELETHFSHLKIEINEEAVSYTHLTLPTNDQV